MRILFFITLLLLSCTALAEVKGIYINQSTLENTPRLLYLIKQAKSVGVNTFVIDLNRLTKRYEQNIPLVTENGIKYVARIIVFHDGGTRDQVLSPAFWQKRYALAQDAVLLGAKEIQLDYIRYSSKQYASPQNARDIYRVVRWFKNQINELGVPMQVDVFGIASFGEEPHIGQNLRLLANSVDAMCPMNYPSHFEPFRKHAVTPYQTVYKALTALKEQFSNPLPFKLYSYIELSNYRYPLSTEQRLHYIKAQLNAVKDAGADGWYAWSPNNLYDNLFTVLRTT